MSETTARYAHTADPHTVMRKEDQAFIPDDLANRDFQEYCDYVAKGGKTDPYVSPAGG